MKTELDNYIVESNVNIDYFDDIVDFILRNEKNMY